MRVKQDWYGNNKGDIVTLRFKSGNLKGTIIKIDKCTVKDSYANFIVKFVYSVKLEDGRIVTAGTHHIIK